MKGSAPRLFILTSLAATALQAAAGVPVRCNAATGYSGWDAHNACDRLQVPKGGRTAHTLTYDPGDRRDAYMLSFRAASGRAWKLDMPGAVTLLCETYEDDGLLSVQPAMRISVTDGTVSTSAVTQEGCSVTGGANAWLVERKGNLWTVSMGNRAWTPRLSLESTRADDSDSASLVFTASGAPLTVTDILMTVPEETPVLHVSDTASSEGEDAWRILDYTLDDHLLRLGGDYTLYLVPDGKSYDIVYGDGARKNPGRWREGMKKGRLEATPLEGVYNAVWFDSEGAPLSEGVRAQFENESLLVIQFPWQGCTLRLYCCP